ncbi:hypothetical protein V6N11_070399 [Hibiscus sabdariffa]|uniref:Reverse transcriptase zinc-binding domain-containing protein n=1 Tax=Hibiscus sabdariffa TaxID=183260 RepID=A0ABR2QEX1_9ROSI
MSLSSGKEFLLWKAIKSPPSVVADNTPGWYLESSCQFSGSLVYQFREGSAGLEEDRIWTLLAKYGGLLRIKMFLWIVCNDRVLTNTERTRRLLMDYPRCTLCDATVEDISHALRGCTKVCAYEMKLYMLLIHNQCLILLYIPRLLCDVGPSLLEGGLKLIWGS